VASTAPLGGREWWFDAWRVQTDIWPHTQGAGVTVAVLDSGVASVTDLVGVVLPGYDAHDQHGDGRHDIDARSHGTRMATLIAARGNTTGMLGIAPKVKILPVITGDSAGSFVDEEIADAIRWAADHSAKIINMSFGVDGTIGRCPPTVRDAVRHAVVDRDAVLVASAGNSGDGTNDIEFPAGCAGVVAVGAVDRQARPWPKSQRQPYVDVAAPGVDMVGIDRTGRLFVGADGTSDAAALTSAGIALIRSAHPELNGRQVVARLLATLRDRPPDGRKDPQRGYGTIRLNKAVNDPVPADAPNPVYDELQPGTPSGAPTAGPGQSGPAAGAPARPGDHTVVVIAALAVAGVLVVGRLVVPAVRRRRQPPLGARYPPGPTYRPTAGGQPYQPPAGGPPYQPPRQPEPGRAGNHGQPRGHGQPHPHPPPAPPTGRPGG
jgi:subtilisin family serine protease